MCVPRLRCSETFRDCLNGSNELGVGPNTQTHGIGSRGFLLGCFCGRVPLVSFAIISFSMLPFVLVHLKGHTKTGRQIR